jgi:hypothetical protein
MIAVNFLGAYAGTPRILRHTNDYCSYADTIMPNFLFAVGFALAIVWSRVACHDPRSGRRVAWRLARRCASLMLVAMIVYFPWHQPDLGARVLRADFWFQIMKKDWFQTLNHIAWATLWVLPVLRFPWRIRWAWLGFGMLAHLLLSASFYFHWVHAPPSGIDGGPLGFLTWSISVMLGLWAGERYLKTRSIQGNHGLTVSLRRHWLVIASLWMLVGWGSSCATRRFDRPIPNEDPQARLARDPVFGRESPPLAELQLSVFPYLAELPFVPPPPASKRAWNYWMMSQRAGTISYQVFAAGLSLGLFVCFDWLMVLLRTEVGLFRTMGRNAIVCYVAHGYVIDFVGQYLEKNTPMVWVGLGLATVLGALYLLAKLLEWRQIFVRL